MRRRQVLGVCPVADPVAVRDHARRDLLARRADDRVKVSVAVLPSNASSVMSVISVLIPRILPCRAGTSRRTGDESGAAMMWAVPGLHDDFARYTSTAHWVHDVLIVHGGTFLIQTLPLGVTGCSAHPEPAAANSRLKRLDSPVTMRFTLDSGAEVELACAAADASRLLGPYKP
jgi:hypothetical protein